MDAARAQDDPTSAAMRGVSRRALLGGFTLGGVGAALAGTAGPALAGPARAGGSSSPAQTESLGQAVVPFQGAHQAGIETPLQGHATFVALDLATGMDPDALRRLMLLLTDDIDRLTRGVPALADPEPELAGVPARLTVTVGFGPGFLAAAGASDQAPAWLADGLPAFSIDKLADRWSDGDLLLVVASEDPMTVSHTLRVLINDAGPFASVRWSQAGFHRPVHTSPGGTGRNLMGQVDGTVNPEQGTQDFADVVWIDGGPAWLVGGTAMVLRRIAMDLRTWGGMDLLAKEQAIGRTLSDGGPLTGGGEFEAPDYEAVDGNGFLVIPPTAHMRLAHATVPAERILRRPYNYDDGFTKAGDPDAGLLFAAWMADPLAQFVPVQERLAEADVLNVWTTPIGSALFAIPRGVAPGEYIGQALLA
ncbi:MAG: Dyp-type peroxidase [Candidatus Nanopelagicales bacterium]